MSCRCGNPRPEEKLEDIREAYYREPAEPTMESLDNIVTEVMEKAEELKKYVKKEGV